MNSKNTCLRVILSLVLLIIVIGLMLCGAMFQFFSNWHSTSPTELVRQRTEEIIQSAKYPRPTHLYTSIPELNTCMDELAAFLMKNQDQYTIVIRGIWGDYASPIPGTGTITATVDIVFPDNHRVELSFYGYALIGCWQTQDELF